MIVWVAWAVGLMIWSLWVTSSGFGVGLLIWLNLACLVLGLDDLYSFPSECILITSAFLFLIV